VSDFISRSTRPSRSYKRRFMISRHALDRFRERVDEEFRHRDDDDLGNLLDERVQHAEFTYQVRDPRAPDAITTLRSVACRHATYYAVVRSGTVITVLDEEMARNNFDGQWSPILNAPFEVLRGLKIPPQVPALPAAAIVAALPAAASLEPVQSPPPSTPTPPLLLTPLLSPTPPLSPTPTTPPPPPPSDPLAEAGAAYARARKRRHACAAEVAALKEQLDRATEALLEAELAVEETHQQLIGLTDREGGDLP
jgi:hypothetical protein